MCAREARTGTPPPPDLPTRCRAMLPPAGVSHSGEGTRRGPLCLSGWPRDVGRGLYDPHEAEEGARCGGVHSEGRLEAIQLGLRLPLAVHDVRGSMDGRRDVRPKASMNLREKLQVVSQEDDPLRLHPCLECELLNPDVHVEILPRPMAVRFPRRRERNFK